VSIALPRPSGYDGYLTNSTSPESVLVVEYGELGNTMDILLPNATSTLSQNARYMWNFTSIPQSKLNGRTDIGYAGMLVGGSSSVNGMFFDRPAAPDLYVMACFHLDIIGSFLTGPTGMPGHNWVIPGGTGQASFHITKR
jgi:choline dehydrogenase-like flavoprotein